MSTDRSFSKLYHDIADNKAWQSLSRDGKLAYFNLLFCYRGNPKFKCPRSKLKIYMSPRKFTAGIRELEQMGFVTVKRFKPLSKIANQYTFINLWKRWK
jgi:hypothetical protein